MVAAHSDADDTCFGDRGHKALHALQRLLDVPRSGGRVAEVDRRQGPEHLHALDRVVRSDHARCRANRFRAEPSSGPKRRTTVPWEAVHGGVHPVELLHPGQPGVRPWPGKPGRLKGVPWLIHSRPPFEGLGEPSVRFGGCVRTDGGLCLFVSAVEWRAMEINPRAPAVARGEIEVAASVETVWRVLTEIAGWPTWNPDVTSATLDGSLAPGTKFSWKAGPGTITSTLQSVEPPHRIAWTGATFGIKAIHVHQLEEQIGRTLVRSEESWDGLFVRLLRGSMTKTLQKAIDSGLRHLKIEAERQEQAQTALGWTGTALP